MNLNHLSDYDILTWHVVICIHVHIIHVSNYTADSKQCKVVHCDCNIFYLLHSVTGTCWLLASRLGFDFFQVNIMAGPSKKMCVSDEIIYELLKQNEYSDISESEYTVK
jgi:hypothetical protein